MSDFATRIIHSAAELVTCQPLDGARGPRAGAAQSQAGIIPLGAVAIKRDRILAVGETEDIISQYKDEHTKLVEATGKTVTPGLVDPHTHLVWAGWRDEEYELRLKGAT